QDRGERGIAGVAVSNGREVVHTDRRGRYELQVRDKDTVFISKPAGWDTPVNDRNVAQFFYHHAPQGTHEQQLRFGGLQPTGDLPDAVNFPLAANPSSERGDTKCLALGDVQTYSNNEISHARNGAMRDIAGVDDADDCGVLMIGDIAGDDLGMYPRLQQNLSVMGKVLRGLPGNHDYDIDATNTEWAFDTYRQAWGPENYSYEVGDVHIMALNNVKYPCTPDLNTDGKRPHCADPAGSPQYSGQLGAETLEWIRQDLARVPRQKRIVIATHIPMVSHADAGSTKHQTQDLLELIEILNGRPTLTLSGHTHSVENMVPGDSLAEWSGAVGLDKLPFHNIVVGAVSGDWYSGDLNIDGVPNALQRDGAVPGYFALDLGRRTEVATFHATGRPGDQMGLGVNTPHWRNWAQTLLDWRTANPVRNRDAVPPVTVGDLGDQNMVSRADLRDGSWLTANVWNSTTDSKVTVSINGAAPVAAELTQPARGEEVRRGVEWADPYAATRQLTVARFAYESTSGDPDGQGFSLYAGTQYGPSAPRPGNNIAVTMTHLWKLPLAQDLPNGVHRADWTWTDRHGRDQRETILFEVVDERPEQWNFRTQVFAD
ncbi:MAG: calcineurin-like phosphoesterase C-terminal domain-containing protein, partial [Propionibacteriaceae bacterium]|nr:calcineurin-like phosphoesterase C-terminal domain-containing protein [Propionibacteriaceae bacterium]